MTASILDDFPAINHCPSAKLMEQMINNLMGIASDPKRKPNERTAAVSAVDRLLSRLTTYNAQAVFWGRADLPLGGRILGSLRPQSDPPSDEEDDAWSDLLGDSVVKKPVIARGPGSGNGKRGPRRLGIGRVN